MPIEAPPPLILASSSPYRRELLARLRLPFSSVSPDIDESTLPEESAAQAVIRLAGAKALKVAEKYPSGLIIASDQLLVRDGEFVSKPGSIESARAQLAAASGRTLTFYTSLCVRAPTGAQEMSVTTSVVTFRKLTAFTIERYLALEKPIDCAGAFKCEGLGIALLARIESADPTALIGLPLIALVTHLERLGVAPLPPLPAESPFA